MDTELKKYLNLRYIICAMIESKSIGLKELIEWVDHLIISLDKPTYWLLEISVCSNLNEIDCSIRISLANEDILDHDCIDSLVIGLAYIRYKDGFIDCKEMELILTDYFVSNKPYFNEDSLHTYFDHVDDNSELNNYINNAFIEYEYISREALEYFYSERFPEELG